MNEKSRVQVRLNPPVKIGIILPPSMHLEFQSIKTPEEIQQALNDETTSVTNRIDRHIRGKVEGYSFYFSTNWVDPNLPETDDSTSGSFMRAVAGPVMRSSAEGQGYATLLGTVEAGETGSKVNAKLEVTSGLVLQNYALLAMIGAILTWAFYPVVTNPTGNAGMLLALPLVFAVLLLPLFMLHQVRSEPKNLIDLLRRCV